MANRRLLLDAGNTRVKWALSEDSQFVAQGSATYSDLDALKLLLKHEANIHCYIASVAAESQGNVVRGLLETYSTPHTWLKAAAVFGDVINTYENPLQLGVDRWMGLIASRARSVDPTLVVSAGTAMTVDGLAADGHFLGGLILPGVDMMQRALQHGTAHVHEVGGEVALFPQNTADAVQSGIIAALCGAIQRQHHNLHLTSGVQPRLLLTGGDAACLVPYLDLPAEVVPSLILEGVERVTRKSEST